MIPMTWHKLFSLVDDSITEREGEGERQRETEEKQEKNWLDVKIYNFVLTNLKCTNVINASFDLASSSSSSSRHSGERCPLFQFVIVHIIMIITIRCKVMEQRNPMESAETQMNRN